MAARILSAHEMEAERQAIAERVKATHGVDYLQSLPPAIPPGKVLLHNRVQPTRRLGSNGFRAWLVDADDDRHARRVVCDCGWAPELGTHYRVVWTNETH
jgi:hypothetical protein